MISKASAPGKVILFGEHAVVYGRPALAVPVHQLHVDVEISARNEPGVWFDAPEVQLSSALEALDLTHPLRSAVERVASFLGVQRLPALAIKIKSSIPVASGLGSGAAVSVALIRALAGALSRSLTDAQVNELAYEVEKIHHGTPSGIDNTVITYARPVFFIKDQRAETFYNSVPFNLVIGDTGIAAPTRESVGAVRGLWQADPPHWEAVFDEIGKISRQARRCMKSGEWPQLGPLMNANHALLQEMTVSSAELDRLVQAALAAGALGAKLSGGGRGGNMLALAAPNRAPQLAQALRAAGARNIIITEI